MDFDEYSSKINCIPLSESEQSKTFLVEKDGSKRVCKKFPNLTERLREETGYFYLGSNNFLNIPKLTLVGEDFLEIEFIESSRNPTLEEAITGVTRLYSQTQSEHALHEVFFPSVDLSKDKILYRLGYLEEEMKKREIEDTSILHNSERFVRLSYVASPQKCLVHGDLKSPHILINEKGTYYIDLGLVSIASPWYDLAFLFMEQIEKKGFLEKLTAVTHKNLGQLFGISLNETKNYLCSGIFYRCLYDFGFALRHRTTKTIKRTMNELNLIMDEK